MSDPTQLVLTGGLAAVIALFVVSVAIRAALATKPAETLPTLPNPDDGQSPYEPPAKITLPPPLPVGKVPVWFYHPLDLIGAAFVLLVFGALIVASFNAPEATTASLSPMALAINIAFQFIIAGVIVSLVIWRVSVMTWLGLRWSAWQWVLLIAPCTVVAMWVFFGALQFSGYMKWMESLGVETVQDTVKLLQQSKDPLVIALMAIAAVVAAPVCEEIVFRGYFYPVLKRFAGVWPAAICSAFVFSAAHGSLAALLPLCVFGGLLVLVYEKTGSIWAPIAVHFCFNGATVILQLAARHYNIPLDGAP